MEEVNSGSTHLALLSCMHTCHSNASKIQAHTPRSCSKRNYYNELTLTYKTKYMFARGRPGTRPAPSIYKYVWADGTLQRKMHTLATSSVPGTKLLE